MSKQVLAIVVVVILLALAGGYFAFTTLTKPALAPSPEISSQNDSTNLSSSSQGSLKDLLGQKNVTCVATFPEQGGTGTIFVADKKVRVDSTMKVNEVDTATHMVYDGDFFYMWSDGTNMGTKMKIDLASQATASATNPQAPNLDQQVDYECSPWSVDNSKFSLPANIQFRDLSTLLSNPQGSTVGSPLLNSSLCDQITEPEAKAACLKALNR